jgi:hypothetical protein
MPKGGTCKQVERSGEKAIRHAHAPAWRTVARVCRRARAQSVALQQAKGGGGRGGAARAAEALNSRRPGAGCDTQGSWMGSPSGGKGGPGGLMQARRESGDAKRGLWERGRGKGKGKGVGARPNLNPPGCGTPLAGGIPWCMRSCMRRRGGQHPHRAAAACATAARKGSVLARAARGAANGPRPAGRAVQCRGWLVKKGLYSKTKAGRAGRAGRRVSERDSGSWVGAGGGAHGWSSAPRWSIRYALPADARRAPAAAPRWRATRSSRRPPQRR